MFNFVIYVLLIFCTSAYAEDVTVNLPNYGSIIGEEKFSRNKVKFFSFRGVQYAEPPTEDLRFQDPQKPKPWGTREAKEFGNRCPQAYFRDPSIIDGKEDCLNLNVYTPMLDPKANLPVMLWVHGGGFVAGGGSTYEPDYFMDKPLVFVTFNYRLNAFGFMHFDDELLSGNYGMKDIVAVLEWVKEHIGIFGGNADQVTLAGSSSGGAAINWLMYSPLSQGLFHQAICQSGNARSMWAGIPRHVAQKRASAIATMAGCVYKSTVENVKCLRRISMEELVRIQTRFDIWKGNPFYFGVVVESPTAKKPFITVNPWDANPPPKKIPLMIGFTSNEGGFTALGLLENQGEALEELGQRYERLFPVIMLYQFNLGLETEEALFQVTKDIRDQYFEGVEINKSTFPQIKEMLADSQIIYDTFVTIKTYDFPTYFYIYSHRNERTFAEVEPNHLDAGGPVHSDDLLSLFPLKSLFPDAKDLNEADSEVSHRMINLWASFITHGDPNIGNDNELKWTPVVGELFFYSIDVTPVFQKFNWQDPYSFWKRLGWHHET